MLLLASFCRRTWREGVNNLRGDTQPFAAAPQLDLTSVGTSDPILPPSVGSPPPRPRGEALRGCRPCTRPWTSYFFALGFLVCKRRSRSRFIAPDDANVAASQTAALCASGQVSAQSVPPFGRPLRICLVSHRLSSGPPGGTQPAPLPGFLAGHSFRSRDSQRPGRAPGRTQATPAW